MRSIYLQYSKNLDTKLNFRATIPSNESDKPITAINVIKTYELKLSGS